MIPLTRITFDPYVMGGKPCIRGMRVTVGDDRWPYCLGTHQKGNLKIVSLPGNGRH